MAVIVVICIVAVVKTIFYVWDSQMLCDIVTCEKGKILLKLN